MTVLLLSLTNWYLCCIMTVAEIQRQQKYKTVINTNRCYKLCNICCVLPLLKAKLGHTVLKCVLTPFKVAMLSEVTVFAFIYSKNFICPFCCGKYTDVQSRTSTNTWMLTSVYCVWEVNEQANFKLFLLYCMQSAECRAPLVSLKTCRMEVS